MPSIVTEMKNIRALEGDRVKFKCTFSGNPPPGLYNISLSKAFINKFNQIF